MTDAENLLSALRIQSGACAALDSAFSGRLLECAVADVTAGGPSVQLFAPWSGDDVKSLMYAAVPIRMLGALHDHALSGGAPDLAAAYPAPGRPGNAPSAWAAALTDIEADPSPFAAFMAHEPQTNEVRRSACLLGGFLTIAKATGLPLRLLETGASAGLNQLWDRYRFDLGGGGAWGDPGAAVRIDTDWRGPPPPLDAEVRVIARAACDRKPIDLADPLARRRLRAFVWADQLDRLARLEAAIGAALAANLRVEAADAVAWAAAHVAPAPGAATVLFHSVFWQYMPAASQEAFVSNLEEIGASATAESPLAWLRMEPPMSDIFTMEVSLTLWPGGERRRLASCHPHGAWVEWNGWDG